VAEIEFVVATEGHNLAATLSLPARDVRAGLVALHGASKPSRDTFLYRHLAELLPAHGIAVLLYDRRPGEHDIPLETQATDALATMRLLSDRAGAPELPVGLWGWSQGAWAAAVAAARSEEVAFLVLVGCAGMSPALQMRYYSGRQLRNAGYGNEAQAECAELRSAWEGYLRGEMPRPAAQAVIDKVAGRPWFPLVYVPRELPAQGSWADMDFDPAPIFEQVRCPVLLVYGEDDDEVPIEESIAAWRAATARSGNRDLTVVRVPGTGHTPTFGEAQEVEAVSPFYTEKLIKWLSRHAASPLP
jgi:pimeloyl-ACP methyl ester carboxylesterase